MEKDRRMRDKARHNLRLYKLIVESFLGSLMWAMEKHDFLTDVTLIHCTIILGRHCRLYSHR